MNAYEAEKPHKAEALLSIKYEEIKQLDNNNKKDKRAECYIQHTVKN